MISIYQFKKYSIFYSSTIKYNIIINRYKNCRRKFLAHLSKFIIKMLQLTEINQNSITIIDNKSRRHKHARTM